MRLWVDFRTSLSQYREERALYPSHQPEKPNPTPQFQIYLGWNFSMQSIGNFTQHRQVTARSKIEQSANYPLDLAD